MIFNQTGYFGRGAIAHIAPEIARRSLTKAFIVTDPVLADNGTAARITDLLDEAGIGWEVFSDVITDTSKQRKFVCVDPHDIPVLAIVDPDLMDGIPRSLKVATGLDALTHAIEGYITPGAWDLSDALCLRSIQMIAANLRAAADGDVDAVEQMGLAAYINGMAYSNVGLGLVHGMAHPLGGRYNAPHGVANGILLAPVMAFNAEHTGEKYRDIAEAFGVDGARTMPLEEARAAAVEAVAQLTRDLGNPTRISQVRVEADGIEALADDAFADVCTPGNPRPATREDIKALYTSLL